MTKKLLQFINSIEYDFFNFDDSIEKSKLLDIEISNLAFDSRDVTDGTLFFALPGTHTTGNYFISQALKNGASAVVFQDEIDDKTLSEIKSIFEQNKKQVAFIHVQDSRFVMAPLSAEFYDNPSKKLGIIGVTGTEGKSSTVSFIWQLLRLNGKKSGFISTVQYSVGDEDLPNPQHTTTPEAPIIQKYLWQMVQNGCEYAVLETSSHGLSPKLNRTGCIDFDCGVFMNVTLEHLEFHGTFEQYRDDKANLFRNFDKNDHKKTILGKDQIIPSFGVVNLEDKSAEYFINSTKQKVFGFTTLGKAGKQAVSNEDLSDKLPKIPANIEYLTAKNIVNSKNSLAFDFNSTEGLQNIVKVESKLPGAFNAYNIMAALLIVSKLTGIKIDDVAKKVDKVKPVKGRMTVLDEGQPFEVIVDYAHTPSSFETIFPPIKNRCKGKIISVFGSGGERDTKKRPLQGEVAALYCDIIILTDEDPRGEDRIKLLEDIAVGAYKNGKVLNKDLFITPDRPEAIRQAFKFATANDIVLLLGKSHENSIIYKDKVMKYDEISEAISALNELK